MNRDDRRGLRDAIIAAEVPHFQFGREMLFSESAFVAWIERNQITKSNGKEAA